jgi:hypothetical protein
LSSNCVETARSFEAFARIIGRMADLQSKIVEPIESSQETIDAKDMKRIMLAAATHQLAKFFQLCAQEFDVTADVVSNQFATPVAYRKNKYESKYQVRGGKFKLYV